MTVREAPAGDVPRVLVVDDDAKQRRMIAAYLERSGLRAFEAEGGEAALTLLAQEPVGMVVSDVRMPGMDGLTLMKKIRETWPELPVLLVTAYGHVRDAVSAVQDGAVNYLEKPIDFDELLATIRHALGLEAAGPPPGEAIPDLPEDFVLQSPAMRDMVREVALVAPSEVRVLITGENGTGKEVVADLVHRWSKRAEKPLLKVNCAAIPENLLESELFGHEKGAFTGAAARRAGLFEQADGGTVFLDEIGEMPLPLQVKLLRVTEQGTYIPVGGREQRCDVRILAATNRDLEAAVADGRFREDLFYRLNTFELFVPPLRERREDIVPLAHHFARTFGAAHKRFSPSVISLLNTYDWPGNVRELRNALERAILMAAGSDVILAEHLPKRINRIAQQPVQAEPAPPARPIEEIERITILQTLKKNEFNRSRTARELGMPRRTLTYKLRRLREAGFEVDPA